MSYSEWTHPRKKPTKLAALVLWFLLVGILGGMLGVRSAKANTCNNSFNNLGKLTYTMCGYNPDCGSWWMDCEQDTCSDPICGNGWIRFCVSVGWCGSIPGCWGFQCI
jgi:hypothetical protein